LRGSNGTETEREKDAVNSDRRLSEMDQVKTFKITGYIKKHGTKISFTKNVRALNEPNALEKIYSEIGSRHKAKRFDIKVTAVQESQNTTESR